MILLTLATLKQHTVRETQPMTFQYSHFVLASMPSPPIIVQCPALLSMLSQLVKPLATKSLHIIEVSEHINASNQFHYDTVLILS